VLADDHRVVRQGLATLLRQEPGFQVVGETSYGREAIQLVESFNPDILVLALVLDDVSGFHVVREVSEHSPRTKIVILSMYGTTDYVREALKAGAKAYVLKDSTSEELVQAIREVAAGRYYIDKHFAENIIDNYTGRARIAMPDPYDKLTNRQREVLHLWTQGLTNAEIAERLYISPRTVEKHRTSLMRRLNLRNRHELVNYVLKRGLLPPNKSLPGSIEA